MLNFCDISWFLYILWNCKPNEHIQWHDITLYHVVYTCWNLNRSCNAVAVHYTLALYVATTVLISIYWHFMHYWYSNIWGPSWHRALRWSGEPRRVMVFVTTHDNLTFCDPTWRLAPSMVIATWHVLTFSPGPLRHLQTVVAIHDTSVYSITLHDINKCCGPSWHNSTVHPVTLHETYDVLLPYVTLYSTLCGPVYEFEFFFFFSCIFVALIRFMLIKHKFHCSYIICLSLPFLLRWQICAL